MSATSVSQLLSLDAASVSISGRFAPTGVFHSRLLQLWRDTQILLTAALTRRVEGQMEADRTEEKPLITSIANLAARLGCSHLVGTYVSCVVFSAHLGWEAPLMGWVLTSLLLIPVLVLASPYVAIMLFLLKWLRSDRKSAFALAGSFVGLFAFMTAICLLPKPVDELSPLMAVAAMSGGAAAGLLYRLMETAPRKMRRKPSSA